MLKVTTKHYILDNKNYVKVYLLNNLPFTWDELPKKVDDKIINEAKKNGNIFSEDILKKSAYLIMEGLHPLLFDIALDPNSELPDGFIK